MVITLKVAGTLWQRYVECTAASKPPEDGIVRIYHVYNIKCYVLCAGVFWGAKGDGKCYYSDRLDCFVAEAIEGLRRFLELLLVITQFLEVDRKSISARLPLSTMIFDVPSIDVDGEHHSVRVRE
jgi:hypothetical protein